MATILAERPLETRVSESEDTGLEGEFTSDEDLDAQATDMDAELTADESVVNMDLASKVVCQETPQIEELEVEASAGLDVGRGRRFFSRLLGWVIWLLGICFRRLAIVLHVCWLAATGGNVGVSGLWEVFSLLVVVLAQELLQLMLASRNRPQPVALSQPPPVPQKKKEEEVENDTVDETEVAVAALKNSSPQINKVLYSQTTFNKVSATRFVGRSQDEDVLNVETAGDTLPPEFCERNLLPNSSAVKILTKSSRTDTPMNDLVMDERTGSPVVAMGLEGSAVGDVGGGPKTSWGMEVNVLLAQHPTPKMPVPVWDLYAPSDAVSHAPTSLSCSDEEPQEAEGNVSTLTSLATPPVTPVTAVPPTATDSTPGNVY